MSILTTFSSKTPHLDSMMPYGYRFEAIKVYDLDYFQNIDVYHKLRNSHKVHDISIGKGSPNRDHIIFKIASFIEGNFGPPYQAIIVHCHYSGIISIYTPKNDQWWKAERWSGLSNYLMGLRSLLDLQLFDGSAKSLGSH